MSVEFSVARYKDKSSKLKKNDVDSNPYTDIKIRSQLHPEHPFQIGFVQFTNNYSLGFNRVVKTLTGEDFHKDILDNIKSENWVFPDWNAILKNASRVREKFIAASKQLDDCYVLTISTPKKLSNVKTAISYFREHLQAEDHSSWLPEDFSHFFANGMYRNLGANIILRDALPHVRVVGRYFDQPITVKAIMGGEAINPHTNRIANAVYVAFHQPGFFDYYIKGLEIIEETAKWVLEQENPSEFAVELSL